MKTINLKYEDDKMIITKLVKTKISLKERLQNTKGEIWQKIFHVMM